jgi:hypothetical protein
LIVIDYDPFEQSFEMDDTNNQKDASKSKSKKCSTERRKRTAIYRPKSANPGRMKPKFEVPIVPGFDEESKSSESDEKYTRKPSKKYSSKQNEKNQSNEIIEEESLRVTKKSKKGHKSHSRNRRKNGDIGAEEKETDYSDFEAILNDPSKADLLKNDQYQTDFPKFVKYYELGELNALKKVIHARNTEVFDFLWNNCGELFHLIIPIIELMMEAGW